MKPIPIFGTGTKARAGTVTAQRRVNCYFDIRTDGDKSNIIVRGTPGSAQFIELTDGPIRGWRVISGYLYVVAGASVFQVSTGGAAVNLGAVDESDSYVSMSDDSVTLVIVNGVNGYTVALPTGAPTLITDPNFPNGATTVANINSHFVVEYPNSRQFGVAQLLSGTTWSPQIYGTKENSSDYTIAVDNLNGVLLLWGSKSLEFWQDIGSSPNPFSRIQGSSQSWGLAAKNSRAYLGNTIVFLGENPNGGVQILRLNGYTPQKISSDDIDDIITNFAVYNDAVALTYMTQGHPMYQITFPTEERSFLYDSSTGIWYETQTGLDLRARHFGNLSVSFNSKNYVSDVSSGKIYQLVDSVYDDDGVAILREITSRHIRVDGNEFGISELVVEMETGVGLSSGQGSDPQIMMQYSIDGGRTFGAEDWHTIGAVGEYETQIIWDRLGSARDFVFRFKMTDPVPFYMQSAQAVVSPGTEASQ